MIDATCNYLNPFATSSLTNSAGDHSTSITATSSLILNSTINEFTATKTASAAATTLYKKSMMPATTANGGCNAMKMEVQYPPQASSTGSISPNSSVQSAPSSASVSPSIFPLPAQTFASISASPPTAVTAPSAQPFPGSHPELGAAAAAAATAYSWNTAAYTTALPTSRSQFPYAQYASDYYGNVGMPASAGPWFPHQDRLYQSWSGQTYPTFNFDDIAFQTQLQRRSVRCTCPNCTNEMSGLPPIVGPDERGRKQHICHIPGCERLYGKASHLKTHLRWHTGERPFLCLTCGKRFSRSDELQRHGRTHTNYRPYACPICSKKFSRSDHLSKHKKTHFKDKKNKKGMINEPKDQNAVIKQEKSQNAGHEKSTSIKAPASITTAATATLASKASSFNHRSNTIQSNEESLTQTLSRSQESQSKTSTQLPLKNEHPEIPSGYNLYSNLYHQSPALFHPHLNTGNSYCAGGTVGTSTAIHQTAPPPTFDLWNSHTNRSAIQDHQQQQPSSGHQHQSISSTMTSAAAVNGTAIITSAILTNHSTNLLQRSSNASNHHQQQQQPQHQHHHQQHQQQQPHHQHQQHKQQLQQHNTQVTITTSEAATSAERMSQHYAVLALQNESQLAAEYGLAIPTNTTSVSSTASVYHPHHSHHSPPIHHSHTPIPQHSTTYTSFIGPMKSEYPTYTTDFSSNSSYSTTTSAFHHHHNPWASTSAYQHSHATA